MTIKLDASTNANDCKVLMKGVEVVVDLHNGGDGFLHASRVSNTMNYTNANIAVSQQSTVVGKISSDSTTEKLIILLDDSGKVTIKLDNQTDYTDVSFLMPKKVVSVQAAPGSDGYLHAVKISDVGAAAAAKAKADTTSTTATTNTVTVSGTVANGTNDTHLYLRATEGTYTIIMDSNTDKSGANGLTVGKAVNASIYRGADAYMHAAKVWVGSANTSSSSSSSSSVNTAGQTTYSVSGTIAKGSDNTYLYLNTSGSTYKFKIDSYSTAIEQGKEVKVTFYNPGDGILHAATVVAK